MSPPLLPSLSAGSLSPPSATPAVDSWPLVLSSLDLDVDWRLDTRGHSSAVDAASRQRASPVAATQADPPSDAFCTTVVAGPSAWLADAPFDPALSAAPSASAVAAALAADAADASLSDAGTAAALSDAEGSAFATSDRTARPRASSLLTASGLLQVSLARRIDFCDPRLALGDDVALGIRGLPASAALDHDPDRPRVLSLLGGIPSLKRRRGLAAGSYSMEFTAAGWRLVTSPLHHKWCAANEGSPNCIVVHRLVDVTRLVDGGDRAATPSASAGPTLRPRGPAVPTHTSITFEYMILVQIAPIANGEPARLSYGGTYERDYDVPPLPEGFAQRALSEEAAAGLSAAAERFARSWGLDLAAIAIAYGCPWHCADALQIHNRLRRHLPAVTVPAWTAASTAPASSPSDLDDPDVDGEVVSLGLPRHEDDPVDLPFRPLKPTQRRLACARFIYYFWRTLVCCHVPVKDRASFILPPRAGRSRLLANARVRARYPVVPAEARRADPTLVARPGGGDPQRPVGPPAPFYRMVRRTVCCYGSAYFVTGRGRLARAEDFANQRLLSQDVGSLHDRFGRCVLQQLCTAPLCVDVPFCGGGGSALGVELARISPVCSDHIDQPEVRSHFGEEAFEICDALDFGLALARARLPGMLFTFPSPSCFHATRLSFQGGRCSESALLLHVVNQGDRVQALTGVPYAVETVRGGASLLDPASYSVCRAMDHGSHSEDAHPIVTPRGFDLRTDAALTVPGRYLRNYSCSGPNCTLGKVDPFQRPLGQPCCSWEQAQKEIVHGRRPAPGRNVNRVITRVGFPADYPITWSNLALALPPPLAAAITREMAYVISSRQLGVPLVSYDSALAQPGLLTAATELLSHLPRVPGCAHVPDMPRLLPAILRSVVIVESRHSGSAGLLVSDPGGDAPLRFPTVELAAGEWLFEATCERLHADWAVRSPSSSLVFYGHSPSLETLVFYTDVVTDDLLIALGGLPTARARYGADAIALTYRPLQPDDEARLEATSLAALGLYRAHRGDPSSSLAATRDCVAASLLARFPPGDPTPAPRPDAAPGLPGGGLPHPTDPVSLDGCAVEGCDGDWAPSCRFWLRSTSSFCRSGRCDEDSSHDFACVCQLLAAEAAPATSPLCQPCDDAPSSRLPLAAEPPPSSTAESCDSRPPALPPCAPLDSGPPTPPPDEPRGSDPSTPPPCEPAFTFSTLQTDDDDGWARASAFVSQTQIRDRVPARSRSASSQMANLYRQLPGDPTRNGVTVVLATEPDGTVVAVAWGRLQIARRGVIRFEINRLLVAATHRGRGLGRRTWQALFLRVALHHSSVYSLPFPLPRPGRVGKALAHRSPPPSLRFELEDVQCVREHGDMWRRFFHASAVAGGWTVDEPTCSLESSPGQPCDASSAPPGLALLNHSTGEAPAVMPDGAPTVVSLLLVPSPDIALPPEPESLYPDSSFESPPLPLSEVRVPAYPRNSPGGSGSCLVLTDSRCPHGAVSSLRAKQRAALAKCFRQNPDYVPLSSQPLSAWALCSCGDLVWAWGDRGVVPHGYRACREDACAQRAMVLACGVPGGAPPPLWLAEIDRAATALRLVANTLATSHRLALDDTVTGLTALRSAALPDPAPSRPRPSRTLAPNQSVLALLARDTNRLLADSPTLKLDADCIAYARRLTGLVCLELRATLATLAVDHFTVGTAPPSTPMWTAKPFKHSTPAAAPASPLFEVSLTAPGRAADGGGDDPLGDGAIFAVNPASKSLVSLFVFVLGGTPDRLLCVAAEARPLVNYPGMASDVHLAVSPPTTGKWAEVGSTRTTLLHLDALRALDCVHPDVRHLVFGAAEAALAGPPSGDAPCEPPAPCLSWLSEQLSPSCSHLNATQRDAQLLSRACAVIHGPPGTGKSLTITRVLRDRLAVTARALLCGPSNQSVESVLSKLLDEGIDHTLVVGGLRLGPRSRSRTLPALVAADPAMVAATRHSAFVAASVGHLRALAHYARGLPPSATAVAIRQHVAVALDNAKAAAAVASRLFSTTREAVVHAVLGSTRVFVATCNAAATLSHRLGAAMEAEGVVPLRRLASPDLGALVVDEAGAVLEPDILLPLLTHVPALVLVGDHLQLPPHTAQHPHTSSPEIATTLLRRIAQLRERHSKQRFHELFDFALLRTQYRMPELLGTAMSSAFYAGQVLSGNQPRPLKYPLVFLDSPSPCEALNKSSVNRGDVVIVERLVRHLASAGIRPLDICCIAFYSAQVKLLQAAVGGVAQIATADSIQGAEYDFVILSCVRTGNHLGFLSSDNRVNVALSRARQLMAIVGCHDSLQALPSWRYYLQYPNRVTPDGFIRAFPRSALAKLALSPPDRTLPPPHPASLGGWAPAVGIDPPLHPRQHSLTDATERTQTALVCLSARGPLGDLAHRLLARPPVSPSDSDLVPLASVVSVLSPSAVYAVVVTSALCSAVSTSQLRPLLAALDEPLSTLALALATADGRHCDASPAPRPAPPPAAISPVAPIAAVRAPCDSTPALAADSGAPPARPHSPPGSPQLSPLDAGDLVQLLAPMTLENGDRKLAPEPAVWEVVNDELLDPSRCRLRKPDDTVTMVAQRKLVVHCTDVVDTAASPPPSETCSGQVLVSLEPSSPGPVDPLPYSFPSPSDDHIEAGSVGYVAGGEGSGDPPCQRGSNPQTLCLEVSPVDPLPDPSDDRCPTCWAAGTDTPSSRCCRFQGQLVSCLAWRCHAYSLPSRLGTSIRLRSPAHGVVCECGPSPHLPESTDAQPLAASTPSQPSAANTSEQQGSTPSQPSAAHTSEQQGCSPSVDGELSDEDGDMAHGHLLCDVAPQGSLADCSQTTDCEKKGGGTALFPPSATRFDSPPSTRSVTRATPAFHPSPHAAYSRYTP